MKPADKKMFVRLEKMTFSSLPQKEEAWNLLHQKKMFGIITY